MGGFSHSSFVTLPFSVTGLLASNSAAKEWCPDRGCAAATTSKAPIIKCCVFMFEPDFPLAAARFSLLYNEAFRVRKIFGISAEGWLLLPHNSAPEEAGSIFFTFSSLRGRAFVAGSRRHIFLRSRR